MFNLKNLKMSKLKFSFTGILLCFFVVSVLSQGVSISVEEIEPDESAVLDIYSNNKGVLIPRIVLNSVNDGITISNPATGLLVWNTGTGGLTPEGFYYNFGTPQLPEWKRLINSDEVAVIDICPDLQLGEQFGGGIVVHTSYPASNCGYLIAALEDAATSVTWANIGNIPWNHQNIGWGKDNTQGMFGHDPAANKAHTVCLNWIYTEGGETYDDWFLPSFEELKILILNKNQIGGFPAHTVYYWSSSYDMTAANPTQSAWRIRADQYAVNLQSRGTAGRIRCVRSF